MRLNDELKLTGVASGKRRHATAPGPRVLPAQVASPAMGRARADYELEPPGSGRGRDAAGRTPGAGTPAGRTWRVSRFWRASRDEADFQVSTDAEQRLDKFLRRRLENLPLSHLYKLVRTKKVRVKGSAGGGPRSFSSRARDHRSRAAGREPPPPKPPEAIRRTSRCSTRTSTSSP